MTCPRCDNGYFPNIPDEELAKMTVTQQIYQVSRREVVDGEVKMRCLVCNPSSKLPVANET